MLKLQQDRLQKSIFDMHTKGNMPARQMSFSALDVADRAGRIYGIF